MDLLKICTFSTIGERIKELRTQFGLSQEEFGKKFNVSRSVIGRWESNKQSISSDNIIAISKEFAIPCDTLLLSIKPQYFHIEYVTGLDQKSILMLRKIKRDYPELTKILNYIFNDGETTRLLLDTIYIYAMLNLPALMRTGNDKFEIRLSTYFGNEKDLFETAMAKNIHTILMNVRNKFSDERFNVTEKKLEEFFKDFIERMRKAENNIEEFEQEILEENRIADETQEQFISDLVFDEQNRHSF